MVRLSKPNFVKEQRLLSVDVIRGVAILGCALATSLKLLDTDSSSFFLSAYQKSLSAFAVGTFYPMLAVMFGVSSALYFEGHRDNKATFVRRLLCFAVIGGCFLSNKVLLLFAVGGVVLLLLHQMPHLKIYLIMRILFLGSIILAFISPFAKSLSPVFLVIFGFLAYESGIGSRIIRNPFVARRFSRLLLGFSLFLSVLAHSFVCTKPFILSLQGITLGGFIATATSFICHLDKAKPLMLNLALIGRMPLTLMVGFMAILGVLNIHLAPVGHVFFMMGMTFVAIICCRVWFNYFQYGPLEWLLRVVSRGQPVPFRRHAV